MQAVFAIPGDMHRKTGGFIYEATVLRALNDLGCPTANLQLPDSFPQPTEADMRTTLQALDAVPVDQPIILDGLVFGAIDPAGLAKIRAPVIAMIHHPLGLESGIAPQLAAHLRANEAAALKHASQIVVPSPHTARTLVHQFGADADKITVAPPGFEPIETRRTPAHPPLILSVGLLARRKGHDILLNALAAIKDLPWQAEIIGKRHDVTVADQLLHQCDDLGLSDRVTFLGEVPQAQMTERFRAASIFALATRYEGYGMVLGEAMQHGLPIVTCRTGAVPDTVGDAALLVPPDASHSFANALRRLLVNTDTATTISLRAMRRGRALPLWRDTAGIISDVIARCVRENGAATT